MTGQSGAGLRDPALTQVLGQRKGMTMEDRAEFPAAPVTLKDGRQAILRFLRTDDAELLGEFFESVPLEDFRFFCPHRLDRENAERLARAADAPNRVTLVAECDGRIVGYAYFQWKDSLSEASHFGICVGRATQGTGLGKALMVRINEIAAKVGPPLMRLTVQTANPGAVALYEKMGFRIVREQMRGPVAGGLFPPEPEYLMERRTRPDDKGDGTN